MKKYKSPWLAENYCLLQILILEILEMCVGVISCFMLKTSVSVGICGFRFR